MTFFRRRRKDADLEAEIQAHLAIAVEERVERGEVRGHMRHDTTRW